MSQQEDPLLLLNGLGGGYKPLQILRNIDLTLNQGEWLALLGSNGSGKSTLLKTIAGLLKPFHGKIVYFGEEISAVPVHERVKMGIALVPEGRHQYYLSS